MKKLLLLALVVPAVVFAQTYPAPTFNSVILQNPLTPANGGTGATTSTGTGSVVLSNSPSLASPTITGSLTATGLVTLPSLATQAANTVVANVTGSTASPTAFAMPSCSGANNALRWTAGTGFTCASSIALTSSSLSQFASTTSAQLAGVISDETGTGALVFATNPTLGAATFTGNVAINNSNAQMQVNDTSGTGHSDFYLYNSSSPMWSWRSNGGTSQLQLVRYVGGTLADVPFTVNNSSGLISMIDGLSVTGTVSGTGFSNYLASPPAIGGTAANSGAFTTLSASSTVSGTGFSNYLASPPAIGGTTAAAGSFTALSASTANPTLYYNQGGTGAVNRTYQSKFQEIFDVKDFGAAGNGSTDDTTAQQNAINAACSNGGGIVYYPHGTYKTSSTLNLNCSNVRMIGETKIGSVIASSSTTADTLAIGTSTSTLSSIYVTSLGFVPSVTKTAGNEIHVIGNNTVIDLGDIFANGGFNAVQLDSYGSASLYKVHDFYFENQANQGLLVGTANGLLQDVFIYSGNVAGSSGGMYFQNVSGFYVNNVDVIASTGNGIQIVPVTGGEAVFGFFDTVLSDTSAGYGWLIQSNGTVLVTNIVCNKCWAAASSGVAGVYINAATAGKLNGITFQNSIIRGNQQHGIVVAAGTNIILNANQICSNSMSSSGGYDGIVISPGVTGFTITDNISGQCGYEGAGGTNKQAYGLVLNSSAATNNFIITNNRFPSNVTGGMSNAATGANQIVTNNLSF